MKLQKIMDRIEVLNGRIIDLEKVVTHLGSDRDYIDEKRTVNTILEEYKIERATLNAAVDAVDIDVQVPATPIIVNVSDPILP